MVRATVILQRVPRRVVLVVEGEGGPLPRVHPLQQIAELAGESPHADHLEVAGPALREVGRTPPPDHVHVHFRHDGVPRDGRMVGEPRGPQQAALLRRVRDEKNGTARARLPPPPPPPPRTAPASDRGAARPPSPVLPPAEKSLTCAHRRRSAMASVLRGGP